MNDRRRRIRKLLVANRSEIAIRIMRAATELGINTVAIYSREDRFALHRYKADESYLVGTGKGPVEAYLDIGEIIRIAREAGADAIHPGYGFLSENPDFAEACSEAGLIFIGPPVDVMRRLGSKIAARELAEEAGVPVMPASGPLPEDEAEIKRLGAEIGYPVMVKATWGGGGRGMRVVEGEDEIIDNVTAARREAEAAFGNGEVYLEKLVRNARHVEVQVLGDHHGNVVHLFERDCTVQRRHQKVIERAPAAYLDDTGRRALCEQGLKIARAAGYQGAGTVEFLQSADTGAIYFIEVNPRIQVEHTVTDWVTGIDLVQAQIRIAEGAVIGDEESGVPAQDDIRLYGHAIQCRVTTEDPENNFTPDYGRLTAYRSAAGFGIRLDAGTAFTGALITRYYDSLLVKVTSWAPDARTAAARMDRALREFRIRGVATNLRFLESVINHPHFLDAEYTTNFIDETPELFRFPLRRDRASRMLNFLGQVIVNGNAEVKDRPLPAHASDPQPPPVTAAPPAPGTKQLLDELGAEAFAGWMLDQERALITDTSMRDAHQSLLATRVRSYDITRIAPVYAAHLPGMFSMECWGGATFDVAMRFLYECPWERLAELREAMPNLLTQMLLRASNGVGYTNYPDNVVRYFVQQSADAGMDLFRVFDALNWVENMRVAMDAVLESGKLCEAAICYTGDISDPKRAKYDLKYYVELARELKAAGAHILGIKDMAGLCKPNSARILVKALKEETGLPVHFHTHDTSGISAASVLAAIEAGADAVDAAMDSISGLTSQPNLGAIAEALRNTPRDTGLDATALREISTYWEHVRTLYSGFEADFRSGASEVYSHEIPGGQYTNLRQQARSMGIDRRWPEVAATYALVNEMFGDIIKVTPTSKVVGDLTLMMITGGLGPAEVIDPDKEIAFPDSVISFFRGDLGQPHGGFPGALQKKVLKGEAPVTVRPGSVMTDVDLDAVRAEAEQKIGRHVSDWELGSYTMYPQVFTDYAAHRRTYGKVARIPTRVFFYGMEPGDEISAEIERGKTLIIRFLALGDADENGNRTVFFELNGQPRSVRVQDTSLGASAPTNRVADAANPAELGAPMPGMVASVVVDKGQKVLRGDTLLSIEAMKMETAVSAEYDGTVAEVIAEVGMQVNTKDLLVLFED
ncbi:MAG: pyruvate carboxylase [Acidiferrobacteraceae bacterium]|nr:pyruvate carboxylase [Acidiferrobacteraceae bacterium]MDP6645122.1 pyruvate carboxylase [Rhodospirillales bacterium]